VQISGQYFVVLDVGAAIAEYIAEVRAVQLNEGKPLARVDHSCGTTGSDTRRGCELLGAQMPYPCVAQEAAVPELDCFQAPGRAASSTTGSSPCASIEPDHRCCSEPPAPRRRPARPSEAAPDPSDERAPLQEPGARVEHSLQLPSRWSSCRSAHAALLRGSAARVVAASRSRSASRCLGLSALSRRWPWAAAVGAPVPAVRLKPARRGLARMASMSWLAPPCALDSPGSSM